MIINSILVKVESGSAESDDITQTESTLAIDSVSSETVSQDGSIITIG